jgi:transglutaminase-like putative cysteine protease
MLGIDNDGRYRVVDEERILGALLAHCWPCEVRAGQEAAARRLAGQALERWVAQGLPCRQIGGRRLFDLCEVLNFMCWASRTSGDPLYDQGAVRTFRQAAGGHRGQPLAWRRFEVLLRREFRVGEEPADRPLRLRVPLPLDCPTQEEVSVEVVEPLAGRAQITRREGRLELQLPGPDVGDTVAIDVRVRLRARGQDVALRPGPPPAPDVSEAEQELYTRPSEGLIQVTSTVRQLAASLAGTARDPWEAVAAFWRFFFQRMNSGRVHHDELDRRDPLAALVGRGWFDCLTGSSLLVGLCRARGIAARVINGLTLYPAIPTNHYWAEVLLPPHGWVPVDLASWDLAAGRMGDSPWSQWYLGRLGPRMQTQCLPHLVLGSPGVRFPASWYVVPAIRGEGLEASYHALSGELLYRDWVRVRELPDEPVNSG